MRVHLGAKHVGHDGRCRGPLGQLIVETADLNENSGDSVVPIVGRGHEQATDTAEVDRGKEVPEIDVEDLSLSSVKPSVADYVSAFHEAMYLGLGIIHGLQGLIQFLLNNL